MKRSTIDLWVGIFVALGIAAVVFLSLKVANLTPQSASQTYVVYADFDNVGGLKVKAPVKEAGVLVAACPTSAWIRRPTAPASR
ncbi:Probable phospholipid ABC transporter-binding protein mlaD [Chromobacterium violaceum]|uniref:Probable phospholipid ABC transporter-binding protein mlaD n=1 Tax=Chromobacterium violaceum TaxID=536 RepID=A0A3S4LGG1_CHRVL|nr:Probable phospholipid ABC transporter-binding protein mlaD [Chromobacterium violaceum]